MGEWDYDNHPWESQDDLGPTRHVAEAYAEGLVDAYSEAGLIRQLSQSSVAMLTMGVSEGYKESMFLDSLERTLSEQNISHQLSVWWTDKALKDKGTSHSRSHMMRPKDRKHILAHRVVANAQALPFPDRSFSFIHESLAALWHGVADDTRNKSAAHDATRKQLAEYMRLLTDDGVLIVDAHNSVTRATSTADMLHSAGLDNDDLRALVKDLGWNVSVHYSRNRQFLLLRKE